MTTGIALPFSVAFRMSGFRQGPPDPIPQASQVRKNLFGPIDHEENMKFVQDELNKISQADCRKWNFDFQSEKPKEGRYEWKAVSGKVPQAYEMSSLSCSHNIPLEAGESKPNKAITTTTTTTTASPLPPSPRPSSSDPTRKKTNSDIPSLLKSNFHQEKPMFTRPNASESTCDVRGATCSKPSKSETTEKIGKTTLQSASTPRPTPPAPHVPLLIQLSQTAATCLPNPLSPTSSSPSNHPTTTATTTTTTMGLRCLGRRDDSSPPTTRKRGFGEVGESVGEEGGKKQKRGTEREAKNSPERSKAHQPSISAYMKIRQGGSSRHSHAKKTEEGLSPPLPRPHPYAPTPL